MSEELTFLAGVVAMAMVVVSLSLLLVFIVDDIFDLVKKYKEKSRKDGDQK